MESYLYQPNKNLDTLDDWHRDLALDRLEVSLFICFATFIISLCQIPFEFQNRPYTPFLYILLSSSFVDRVQVISMLDVARYQPVSMLLTQARAFSRLMTFHP